MNEAIMNIGFVCYGKWFSMQMRWYSFFNHERPHFLQNYCARKARIKMSFASDGADEKIMSLML